MDDLEFRRRIMADPKARDAEILAALQSSDSNAQFAEEVLELDTQLEKALKIDVPEDLADRILFTQTTHSLPITNRFSRKMFALAASIAFIAGLLIGQLQWHNILIPPAYASLPDMAIAHVQNEKAFVQGIDEQASNVQINAKMQPLAAKLTAQFPYHVYYLNHCGFGTANAVHLVFAGEKGKVTLFLVPLPSDKVTQFDQQGMRGVVEPIKQSSLIIVGQQNEDISKITAKILPIIQPMN